AFVASLQIDAAVASALPRRLRHVGDAEFDVQLELARELLLGDDVAPAHLHDAAVEELEASRRLAVALDPAIERLAVKEHERAGRSGHARHVLAVLGLRKLQVGDAAVRFLRDGRTDSGEEKQKGETRSACEHEVLLCGRDFVALYVMFYSATDANF